MMRKIINVLLIIVLAMCACACSKAADTTDANMIPINGFKTQSDLDIMRMIGPVGKVNLSDKGACITLTSDPYSSGFRLDASALYLPFSVDKNEADYTDFTNVGFVVFDIYSESETPLDVEVSLVYSDIDLGQMVNLSKCNLPQKFEIKAGDWTRVAYSVKRELIPQTEGISALTVKGMYISFSEVEKETKCHIKDLRFYTTDKPVPTLDTAVKSGEVCSFDSYWQTDLTRVDYYWDTQLIPKIERETSVTSDGIGASLKVTAKAGSAAGSVSQRYPGILLNEKLLASVDLSSYPDNAKFCFDIFAPQKNGLDRIFCSLYVDGTRFFNGKAIYTMPGQWMTVSYTVAELNKAATDDANFAKTNRIYIRWSEFRGSDKVFYIDNFRVVMP